MITFANAALLEAFLRAAETAHKLSGAPAHDWANWYARYLERHATYPEERPAHGSVQVFTPGDSAPTSINLPAQGKPHETQFGIWDARGTGIEE